MTYLTTTKAAERLACSDETVRQMCDAGRFPGAFQRFPGSPWRIPETDVTAIIEAGKARVIRRTKAA